MNVTDSNSANADSNSGAGDADDDALHTSFARVLQAGEGAAAYFYGRLFAGNPDIRGMFPAAMDYQRERLLRALVHITKNLGNHAALTTYLAQLGRDHRKYGVRPEHYDDVGQALLTTFAKFAGDTWTPAAAEAWTATYQLAAKVMTDAAAEAAENTPPWWMAEVVAHRRPARDLAVVTVCPETPVPYEAGQYVSLQVPHRWCRVWRSFSIGNAPRDDGLMDFHVRAVPGGWVSTALVKDTAPGDWLVLGPPAGSMTAEPGSDRPMLCAAGGVGLAPIKALIEHAIQTSAPGQRRPILLFAGARTAAGLYDREALYRLEQAHPWMRVVTAVSDGIGNGPYHGTVPDVLDRLLLDADREHADPGADGADPCRDAYVAGPPAMVQATLPVLSAHGVPDALIRHELEALTTGAHLPIPRNGNGAARVCPR